MRHIRVDHARGAGRPRSALWLVGLMTEPHGHYVRTWRSRHSNGWEAWVGENEHGDFDVWTCPAGASSVSRDTTEDTETHAKDAALLALEQQTEHRCGAECGEWELIEVED
jgi:hypothetical protein